MVIENTPLKVIILPEPIIIPNTSERFQRLKRLYDHINNYNYGYYQSRNFEIIENSKGVEWSYLINELVIEDKPFDLNEIEMMSIIMQCKFEEWTKEYVKLLPITLRIGNEGDEVTIEYIRERHENIEGFIILIKQLKSMLRIYRHTVHETTILIKRSQYDDIVKSHTNSQNITLMVQNKKTFFSQDEQNFIKKDEILKLELKEIENFGHDHVDRLKNIALAMKRSRERYNQNKTLQIQKEKEYVKQDQQYIDDCKKIQKSKQSQPTKQANLNDAYERAVSRMARREEKYKDTSSSKRPLAKVDYHMSKEDNSLINNKKKIKLNNPRVIEPSNITNRELCLLTHGENKAIVKRLAEDYPQMYNTIKTQVNANANLIDKEAKHDSRTHRQINENLYDTESDDDNEDQEDQDSFEDDDFVVDTNQSDEENQPFNVTDYMRVINQHNMEDENDDNENEFDENEPINIRRKGTIIADTEPLTKRSKIAASKPPSNKKSIPPTPPISNNRTRSKKK